MYTNSKRIIRISLLIAILLLIRTTNFQAGLDKIIYQKEFDLMSDIVNDNKIEGLPLINNMNPTYASFRFLIEGNSTYLTKEGLEEHRDRNEVVSFLTINSDLQSLKRIERSIDTNKHLTDVNKNDLKSEINILRNNAEIIKELLNEINI